MSTPDSAAPLLVTFDDARARDWQPFTLTRPAGELRFGALTLRERQERVLGLRCLGHIVAPDLDGFEEHGAPPVLDPSTIPPDRDVVYLSSRAVPAWGAALQRPASAALVTVGGEPCGFYSPAGAARPERGQLDAPGSGAFPVSAGVTMDGFMLDRVWDIIGLSGDQVARDAEALFPPQQAPTLPTGVHRLGEHAIVLGRRTHIEPGVVLDVSRGPILLGDDVRIEAFTRLAGPSAVDRGTSLLGGQFEVISAGPVCKLHGQIEESVILGYANKAHDGFLGHALLGRWVNLGALTTNSDLKNTYGTVRVWTPSGTEDSGALKLGCLLGDHVRTGIGTLLNTGTVVGPGCNLFGAAMPPRYVPPFRWGSGTELVSYELERFLATARTAMARRDVELAPGVEHLLRSLWDRVEAQEAQAEQGRP